MTIVKFNPRLPLIVLDVELEYLTKHTFKMALDTGASFTVITPYAARILGYELTELPTDTLFTATKKEVVFMLELKSLSVQTERIEKFHARCMDLPKELRIDGLVGLNFLRCFNAALNFEEGVFSLERILA